MKFCVFVMIQNIVILIMNIKTGYFLVIQSATLSADLLLRKFIVVVIVYFLHIFFVYKCLFAGFILVQQRFESHSACQTVCEAI